MSIEEHIFEQKYSFRHPSHACLLQLHTLQALNMVTSSDTYIILCLLVVPALTSGGQKPAGAD